MTAGKEPSAAFDETLGLLASEVRIDILRAAWEAFPESLPFSELRSRVGMRDSGTFNYHVDTLVPEFLRKTDGAYTLTYAGRQAIGAAVSGRFTEATDVDAGPVTAGECMHCGGEAVARYDDGLATVACADCEELLAEMPLPPVAVEAIEPDRLPAVFSKHLLTRTRQLARGFCTLCHGRLDATLTGLSAEASATYRPVLDVRFECRECGVRTSLNVGAVLMDHPAVIAFLYDAGIDLRKTYVWEVLPLLDPGANVRSENPLRLELSIRVDGETLTAVVDSSASVLEHTRN